MRSKKTNTNLVERQEEVLEFLTKLSKILTQDHPQPRVALLHAFELCYEDPLFRQKNILAIEGAIQYVISEALKVNDAVLPIRYEDARETMSRSCIYLEKWIQEHKPQVLRIIH